MPAKPWATFRPPDPGREYLALLTELPLARFRDLDKFLLYTLRIEAQLKKTAGVVGRVFTDGTGISQAILDIVGLGRRCRSHEIRRPDTPCPGHAGARRQNEPNSFRALVDPRFRVSLALG
jgi:hypothetical protein